MTLEKTDLHRCYYPISLMLIRRGLWITTFSYNKVELKLNAHIL